MAARRIVTLLGALLWSVGVGGRIVMVVFRPSCALVRRRNHVILFFSYFMFFVAQFSPILFLVVRVFEGFLSALYCSAVYCTCCFIYKAGREPVSIVLLRSKEVLPYTS